MIQVDEAVLAQLVAYADAGNALCLHVADGSANAAAVIQQVNAWADYTRQQLLPLLPPKP